MRKHASRALLMAMAAAALACATTGSAAWLKRQHEDREAPAPKLRPVRVVEPSREGGNAP